MVSVVVEASVEASPNMPSQPGTYHPDIALPFSVPEPTVAAPAWKSRYVYGWRPLIAAGADRLASIKRFAAYVL
jgi:hypothetical protein